MKTHPKLSWLSKGRVSRDGSPPTPGSKWIVLGLVLLLVVFYLIRPE